MFERFTTDARTVVSDAQQHARRMGHRYIGCEHLLLAVVGMFLLLFTIQILFYALHEFSEAGVLVTHHRVLVPEVAAKPRESAGQAA